MTGTSPSSSQPTSKTRRNEMGKNTSPAKLKPVLTYVDVDEWKRIRLLALQNDQTVRQIVSEALAGVLAKHARRAPTESSAAD